MKLEHQAVTAGAMMLGTLAGRARILNETPAPTLETVNRAINELGTAQQEFMARNDERLAQLEATGSVDVVTQEAFDRITETVSNLVDNIERLNTERARPQLGGGAAGDIEAMAARFHADRRGEQYRTPAAGGPEIDVAAYRDYCAAFEALVRFNLNPEALGPDIRAALSIGSDPDGGYWAPAEMSTEIERRIFETSPIRQIANVITIGRQSWQAPYKSADATSGGWVGEKASRGSTATPGVGMQTIEAHEQYAYPEITQSMLEDGAIDMEAFIIAETEDVMSRTENTAFVNGDGVLKPRGFMSYSADSVTTEDDSRSWGVLQHRVSGDATEIHIDDASGAENVTVFDQLIADLKAAYLANARWVMSRRVRATMMSLRDANGNYLTQLPLTAGEPTMLRGYPITTAEDMPTIGAGNFPIAFGDFRRGYMIVDRRGFQILRDPYTNKPLVGFYTTKRTGGDVRNFDAIKLLKVSAS